MRVLIVGSGGREHALAWSLSRSPMLTALFAAPGNPGVAQLATCWDIAANDIEGLTRAAVDNAIDLVVVGPEEPLALGLVDRLAAAGIAAFGPQQAAARLESSKAWAKQFMNKYGIPTAAHRTFADCQAAVDYLQEQSFPLVIKASGLAAGKGAIIVSSLAEAEATVRSMMLDERFGAAGSQVVIESFLQGTELTVLALVSGQDFVILPAAQDHKAVFEGDRGPNTGGMGAYSPVPMLDAMTEQMILERIVHPTLQGLQQEGIHYQGVLYFGLMLTEQGPQVIEYNVRFGDPETQVILPRVQTDLLALMQVCRGRLSAMQVDVSSQACAAVIMAAPGYPASYEKGLPIDGIELAAEAGCLVFQAGTQKADQQLVSAGGRILAVAALGEDLAAALEQAYAGIAKITIPGAHYRRDIGQRALQA